MAGWSEVQRGFVLKKGRKGGMMSFFLLFLYASEENLFFFDFDGFILLFIVLNLVICVLG